MQAGGGVNGRREVSEWSAWLMENEGGPKGRYINFFLKLNLQKTELQDCWNCRMAEPAICRLTEPAVCRS